jgi:LPS O-antigen subunit length determinant protein (WzzB/FepE family)
MDKSNYIDDEINIRHILNIIWKGKLQIITLTVLFSVAAVIFSLSLPNIYQSKALLSSVSEESGVNLGGSGGLASIAGINLANQQGGNSTKALEKVRTLSFFEENILPNIFLPDLMAINSWDPISNTITYNEDKFSKETKNWNEIPSTQQSYKVFMSKLGIIQNQNTGFVTISVKHQSPLIAKAWTELIVDQLNFFFRMKDKEEAEAAMNFLNFQIAQTSYTEIKQVIAQLLQQKMKQLTLIEANKYYVFSYLDPPAVMEEKVEPRRSSISILGAVLGLMLGILIVIIRQYLKDDHSL